MANPCRHRVSLLEMKCAAGVALNQFTLDAFPCGRHKNASEHVCPKRDALTDEEIAQREAESNAATAKALKVIQFISKEHSDLARGSCVITTCPCCDGSLTIAKQKNGHLHVACQTPNCVVFMS